jgi:uncharacterized membrane protein
MYRFFKILVAILIILYPVSVYFGLQYFTPSQLGLFLLTVFVLRVMVVHRQPGNRSMQMLLVVAVGVVLALLTWVFNTEKFLLWYPVCLNSVLFFIFIYSLIFPPSAIEIIARIREPNLDAKGVSYTRNVTIVWAVFFIVNAIISAWTIYQSDMQLWTLYNGLLAYLAMGIIFVVELLVRRRVRKQEI